MQQVTRDVSARTESELRLHAMVRAALSPGIWFVLAAQMLLIFALHWITPVDAQSPVSAEAILLITTALVMYFYFQAGAFHALTLGREALSVAQVIQTGRTVFINFVWLTLKAGLLFALVMNILVLVALMLTGLEFKSLMQLVSEFFGPVTGVLAFVFVYWLPYVFVRREFRLLPSLRASLQIAWKRLPHSLFLVLLVLAPALATGLIPDESPVFINVLVSATAGLLGWVAYIYCVDILQQDR